MLWLLQDLIRRMLTKDVTKRIRTHQIQDHPVFYDANGVNLYFPVHRQKSPALEMMKTDPILVTALRPGVNPC